MAEVKELAEQLVNLTIKEANELAKILEEEYNIKPAAAAVAVAGGGVDGGQGGAEEEKSEYTVVLKAAGGNKIAVIKEVRAITGLGLKEAKDLVDNAPSNVKEAIAKDEAESIKTKLTDAGAEVELK